MSVADAMATNGMKELGFEYINLDGMWILTVLAHCCIRIPYEEYGCLALRLLGWLPWFSGQYCTRQVKISRVSGGRYSLGVDILMDCTLSPAVGWCQSFSMWILKASSLDWYVHVWYWYAVIHFIWFNITLCSTQMQEFIHAAKVKDLMISLAAMASVLHWN